MYEFLTCQTVTKIFGEKKWIKIFLIFFEYLSKSEGLKHPASTQNLIFYLF